MPKKPDLEAGKIYGRLSIINKSDRKSKSGGSFYYCKCSCGNVVEIARLNLSSGHTKSCGCFQKESTQKAKWKNEGESSFNEKYNQYKKNARHKGILFELTKEEFKEIVIKICNYCGKPPTRWSYYLKKDGSPNHRVNDTTDQSRSIIYIHGIDRENNSLGYIKGNCVPCCAVCNLSKHIRTSDEYIAQCRAVVAYQDSKCQKN